MITDIEKEKISSTNENNHSETEKKRLLQKAKLLEMEL